MICFKCKKQLPDGSPFCNFCGAEQSAMQAAYKQPAASTFVQPSVQKKSGRLTTAILAVVIGILAVALIVTLVVLLPRSTRNKQPAVSDGSVVEATQADAQATVVESTAKEEEKEAEKDKEKDAVVTATLSALQAEKAFELDLFDRFAFKNTGSAFTYRQRGTGLFGILSFDGTKDTGAVYSALKALGAYFSVSTATDFSAEDAESLNCSGLVDADGNVLIPMEYAFFEVLHNGDDYNLESDRFIKVVKLTEPTEDAAESVLDGFDEILVLSTDSNNLRFKGTWQVYDLQEKRFVPGLTGTNKADVKVYGDFLVCGDIKVDANGQALPDDADLLGNGFYTICANMLTQNKYTLYDTDHNMVKEFQKGEFIPYKTNGDYILAENHSGTSFTYALMDTDGEIVSAVFSDSSSLLFSDMIYADDRLIDFKGNRIVDGEYEAAAVVSTLRDVIILQDSSVRKFIDKDGKLLYQCEEEDAVTIHASNCLIYKQDDSRTLFYSHAAQDFVLEGSSMVAPFLITSPSNEDQTRDLIDTISGKVLISNYKNYEAKGYIDGALCLLASNDSNTYDVYLIK